MFTIGKLASLTSVSNDTLRYYEHEGLVEPAGKSPAGYRLYDKDSAADRKQDSRNEGDVQGA